jgi:hypothetical protein
MAKGKEKTAHGQVGWFDLIVLFHFTFNSWPGAGNNAEYHLHGNCDAFEVFGFHYQVVTWYFILERSIIIVPFFLSFLFCLLPLFSLWRVISGLSLSDCTRFPLSFFCGYFISFRAYCTALHYGWRNRVWCHKECMDPRS